MTSVPLKVVGKACLSHKSRTFPVVPTTQAQNVRAEFPQRKNTKCESSKFRIQYSEQENCSTARFGMVLSFHRASVFFAFKRYYTRN